MARLREINEQAVINSLDSNLVSWMSFRIDRQYISISLRIDFSTPWCTAWIFFSILGLIAVEMMICVTFVECAINVCKFPSESPVVCQVFFHCCSFVRPSVLDIWYDLWEYFIILCCKLDYGVVVCYLFWFACEVVILMVSVMKTLKLSPGACFLGRGALNRVSALNEKRN